LTEAEFRPVYRANTTDYRKLPFDAYEHLSFETAFPNPHPKLAEHHRSGLQRSLRKIEELKIFTIPAAFSTMINEFSVAYLLNFRV